MKYDYYTLIPLYIKHIVFLNFNDLCFYKVFHGKKRLAFSYYQIIYECKIQVYLYFFKSYYVTLRRKHQYYIMNISLLEHIRYRKSYH